MATTIMNLVTGAITSRDGGSATRSRGESILGKIGIRRGCDGRLAAGTTGHVSRRLWTWCWFMRRRMA